MATITKIYPEFDDTYNKVTAATTNKKGRLPALEKFPKDTASVQEEGDARLSHLQNHWEGFLLCSYLNALHSRYVERGEEDNRTKLENIFKKEYSIYSWDRISSFEIATLNKGFKINAAKKMFKGMAQEFSCNINLLFLDFLKHCEGNAISSFYVIPKENTPENRELAKEKAIEDLSETIKNLEAHIKEKNKQDSDNQNETEPDQKNVILPASQLPFYQDIIQPRLDNYVERRYTIERIRSAIEDPLHSNGFILIEGEPGSGKTTVLANIVDGLIKDNKISNNLECVWHFNSITRHDNRTLSFIDTLFEALSKKYDLSGKPKERYEKQQEDKAIVISDLLPEILNAVSVQIQSQQDRKPLLIIVDALDEVDPNDLLKLKITRQNTLGIPEELPPHIYFLISSRSFKSDHHEERYSNVIETVPYNAEQSHQREDVESYINQQAQENESVKEWIIKNNLNNKSFRETICKVSSYSFIYLYYVFRNINQYRLDNLPEGIDGYYEQQLDRLLNMQDTTPEEQVYKKRILAGIQYFETISMHRLADFSGLSDFSMVEERVRPWLALKILFADKDTGFFLRFYHKSFYDFIEAYDSSTCREIMRISRHDTDHHGCHRRLLEALHTRIIQQGIGRHHHPSESKHIETEIYTIALEQNTKLGFIDYLCDLYATRLFNKKLIDLDIRRPKQLLLDFEKLCDAVQETDRWSDLIMSYINANIASSPPVITFEDVSLTFQHSNRDFAIFMYDNFPEEK